MEPLGAAAFRSACVYRKCPWAWRTLSGPISPVEVASLLASLTQRGLLPLFPFVLLDLFFVPLLEVGVVEAFVVVHGIDRLELLDGSPETGDERAEPVGAVAFFPHHAGETEVLKAAGHLRTADADLLGDPVLSEHTAPARLLTAQQVQQDGVRGRRRSARGKDESVGLVLASVPLACRHLASVGREARRPQA
ncbi:hypothetical protein [Streptomyces sp. 2A115]|uniref:hypothetical protein n=1 Tax=Streptomyces sp. 2A115 TaxID=3457439 RepID=UPI003FCF563C